MLSSILFASVASAGVVHIPLVQRQLSSNPGVAESFSKRSLPPNVDHAEQIMGSHFYETTLQFGTPPQNISCAFDTGSGHLWVPGKNSTACEAGSCRETEGSFDISASSSWRYTGAGGAWGGQGIYGDDTVSYAGQTLEDFNFWVSKDHAWNNYGNFGQARDTIASPKINFCQGLAHAGKISRAVYSLNSLAPITIFNSKHPESEWKRIVTDVYYGGYDKAKYEGPLTAVNVHRIGGYSMPFAGFKVDGESQGDEKKYSIVLDTGGITLSVPNKTMAVISKKHGGEWSNKHGQWLVNCDAKPVLTYRFGYTEIDVDMDQYIQKAMNGPECMFQKITMVGDKDTTLLTGPPAISKAFLIYDNDRGQILVAKAKYTDESEVVEIDGDIPGAIQYTDFIKDLDSGKQTTLAAKATSV